MDYFLTLVKLSTPFFVQVSLFVSLAVLNLASRSLFRLVVELMLSFVVVCIERSLTKHVHCRDFDFEFIDLET